MEAHGEGTLGARLKELRLERALTQVEVSERAGLALDAVSKIETGRRRPRPGTVRKLAGALDVGVEALTRVPSERANLGGGVGMVARDAADGLLGGGGYEAYEVLEALAPQRAAAEGISTEEALARLVHEQVLLARAEQLRKPRLRPLEDLPCVEGPSNAAAAVLADRG